MAIAAISRRRKLLNDDVIVSLADSSWEILDLSGSEVTDSGLMKVAETCKFLRAVDTRYINFNFANQVSATSLLITMRLGSYIAHLQYYQIHRTEA